MEIYTFFFYTHRFTKLTSVTGGEPSQQRKPGAVAGGRQQVPGSRTRRAAAHARDEPCAVESVGGRKLVCAWRQCGWGALDGRGRSIC